MHSSIADRFATRRTGMDSAGPHDDCTNINARRGIGDGVVRLLFILFRAPNVDARKVSPPRIQPATSGRKLGAASKKISPAFPTRRAAMFYWLDCCHSDDSIDGLSAPNSGRLAYGGTRSPPQQFPDCVCGRRGDADTSILATVSPSATSFLSRPFSISSAFSRFTSSLTISPNRLRQA